MIWRKQAGEMPLQGASMVILSCTINFTLLIVGVVHEVMWQADYLKVHLLCPKILDPWIGWFQYSHFRKSLRLEQVPHWHHAKVDPLPMHLCFKKDGSSTNAI